VKPIRFARRERAIVWIWRHLPFNGNTKVIIAWLANLRYAVGVAAVILDDDGNIMIQRHTYRRETFEWGLPGGWAHGRESLERALIREVFEETGFTIMVGKPVAVHSGFAVPRLTVFYLARISGGVFRPSAEVSEFAFRSPDDLGQLLPGEQLAVREALVAAEGPKADLS
jgi:8-oxo-dGTP diphosphatase